MAINRGDANIEIFVQQQIMKQQHIRMWKDKFLFIQRIEPNPFVRVQRSCSCIVIIVNKQ